ncbi:MAG: hypothetical protein KatS3mg073_0405 [Meiothermus sp.]|nr:MAG: hypothetical protein KatS3mg073_0405 [Meiothermus sp.]
MTAQSKTSNELKGLLALATEHARRSSRTPWVSMTIRDTKISIQIRRTYTNQVRVLVASKNGQPTNAQIDFIIKALGLRPFQTDTLPLYGTNAAILLVSEHYDARDLDPRPSPV